MASESEKPVELNAIPNNVSGDGVNFVKGLKRYLRGYGNIVDNKIGQIGEGSVEQVLNLSLTEQHRTNANGNINDILVEFDTTNINDYSQAQIWLREGTDGTWIQKGNTSGVKYIVEDVKSGTRYYVKVVACNKNAGTSDFNEAPMASIEIKGSVLIANPPEQFYWSNEDKSWHWTSFTDNGYTDFFELRTDQNAGVWNEHRLDAIPNGTYTSSIAPPTRTGTAYLFVRNVFGQYSSPAVHQFAITAPVKPANPVLQATLDGVVITLQDLPTGCVSYVVVVDGEEFEIFTSQWTYFKFSGSVTVKYCFVDKQGRSEWSNSATLNIKKQLEPSYIPTISTDKLDVAVNNALALAGSSAQSSDLQQVLNDSKAYADGKLVNAQTYADSKLAEAKRYSDDTLDRANAYVDGIVQDLAAGDINLELASYVKVEELSDRVKTTLASVGVMDDNKQTLNVYQKNEMAGVVETVMTSKNLLDSNGATNVYVKTEMPNVIATELTSYTTNTLNVKLADYATNTKVDNLEASVDSKLAFYQEATNNNLNAYKDVVSSTYATQANVNSLGGTVAQNLNLAKEYTDSAKQAAKDYSDSQLNSYKTTVASNYATKQSVTDLGASTEEKLGYLRLDVETAEQNAKDYADSELNTYKQYVVANYETKTDANALGVTVQNNYTYLNGEIGKVATSVNGVAASLDNYKKDVVRDYATKTELTNASASVTENLTAFTIQTANSAKADAITEAGSLAGTAQGNAEAKAKNYYDDAIQKLDTAKAGLEAKIDDDIVFFQRVENKLTRDLTDNTGVISDRLELISDTIDGVSQVANETKSTVTTQGSSIASIQTAIGKNNATGQLISVESRVLDAVSTANGYTRTMLANYDNKETISANYVSNTVLSETERSWTNLLQSYQKGDGYIVPTQELKANRNSFAAGQTLTTTNSATWWLAQYDVAPNEIYNIVLQLTNANNTGVVFTDANNKYITGNTPSSNKTNSNANTKLYDVAEDYVTVPTGATKMWVASRANKTNTEQTCSACIKVRRASGTYSAITQLDNAIQLKVDSTDFTGANIASKINLAEGSVVISGEKVRIDADHVNINGMVIGGDNLKANSVTASKIAANAVTTDKISAGAVDATKIKAGSIQVGGTSNNVTIQDGAISGAKIQANTITGDKISANSIQAKHLYGENIDLTGSLSITGGVVTLNEEGLTCLNNGGGITLFNEDGINFYDSLGQQYSAIHKMLIGRAHHGQRVFFASRWDNRPNVLVMPASLRIANIAYPAANVRMICAAENIDDLGFDIICKSVIDDGGVGSTTINIQQDVKGNTNAGVTNVSLTNLDPIVQQATLNGKLQLDTTSEPKAALNVTVSVLVNGIESSSQTLTFTRTKYYDNDPEYGTTSWHSIAGTLPFNVYVEDIPPNASLTCVVSIPQASSWQKTANGKITIENWTYTSIGESIIDVGEANFVAIEKVETGFDKKYLLPFKFMYGTVLMEDRNLLINGENYLTDRNGIVKLYRKADENHSFIFSYYQSPVINRVVMSDYSHSSNNNIVVFEPIDTSGYIDFYVWGGPLRQVGTVTGIAFQLVCDENGYVNPSANFSDINSNSSYIGGKMHKCIQIYGKDEQTVNLTFTILGDVTPASNAKTFPITFPFQIIRSTVQRYDCDAPVPLDLFNSGVEVGTRPYYYDANEANAIIEYGNEKEIVCYNGPTGGTSATYNTIQIELMCVGNGEPVSIYSKHSTGKETLIKEVATPDSSYTTGARVYVIKVMVRAYKNRFYKFSVKNADKVYYFWVNNRPYVAPTDSSFLDSGYTFVTEQTGWGTTL